MTHIKLKNEVIDQFIIDVVLIDPIKNIINLLKTDKLRDCDINWLDKKLDNFMKFACETLMINGLTRSDFGSKNDKILNTYTRTQYLKYFTALLNYFESF